MAETKSKMQVEVEILSKNIPNVLKDKNVEELANNIAFDIDIDLTLGVISDFFDCTPVFSILEKIGKVMEKITEKVETEKEKIG